MSSFCLKLIAILTMSIDHLGLVLFNNNLIMRIIGRIAMPIFAFQIAVGFKKTHSKPKYMFRMLLLAIISEIPFNLMLYFSNYSTSNLNICFTFTLALLALYLIDLGKNNKFFILTSLLPILRKFNTSFGLWNLCNTSCIIILFFRKQKKYLYARGNYYCNFLLFF